MSYWNFNRKYAVTVSFIIIVLFSCNETDQNPILKNGSTNGFLKGKITIGPICPVERIPPDPNCQPTADTYKAWATALFTIENHTRIVTIKPDLDGYFLNSLPQGSYILDFDQPHILYLGNSNLPLNFNIVTGDTVNLIVNIDTGIR